MKLELSNIELSKEYRKNYRLRLELHFPKKDVPELLKYLNFFSKWLKNMYKLTPSQEKKYFDLMEKEAKKKK